MMKLLLAEIFKTLTGERISFTFRSGDRKPLRLKAETLFQSYCTLPLHVSLRVSVPGHPFVLALDETPEKKNRLRKTVPQSRRIKKTIQQENEEEGIQTVSRS